MKHLCYSIIVLFALLLVGCADAGNDQEVLSGDSVMLDGSNSTPDAGGELVKYEWKQMPFADIPNITLSDTSSVAPTFTAPNVQTVTELIFQLQTTEHFACFQEKCRENTTIDLVSIFVEPSDDVASGLTISGTVTNMSDEAIPDATVYIGDQQTTTDINGQYSIDNISPAERIVVNVTHPDYLANSRIATLEDTNVIQNIQLGHAKATQTFSTLTGTTLEHNDGAKVELPAGDYIDKDGNAYSGDITVKMSYYPITTRSGIAAFSGTFEGIDGNETFPIQSYGFMNVELVGSQGESLSLAPGKTAKLTFPSDSSLTSYQHIPLWYYDTDQGYWIQEGEATRNGHMYEGTVSHFTPWNLDIPRDRATLTGCVEDSSGVRIEGTRIILSSRNWYSQTKLTGSEGKATFDTILSNENLTMSATKKIDGTWYYGEYQTQITLSVGEVRNLDSCIVLQESPIFDDTVTIHGFFVAPDGSNDLFTGTVSVLDNQTHETIAEASVEESNEYTITFHVKDSLRYSIEFSGILDYGEPITHVFTDPETIHLKPFKTTYFVPLYITDWFWEEIEENGEVLPPA